MEKRVLCEEAEERGERRGERRGIQLGRVSGIISFALDLNYSNEQIISILQKKLGITASQADKYLEQYYSDNL
jgi:predicted transposase YdaD